MSNCFNTIVANLLAVQERNGWTDREVIAMLCDYIGRQGDPDTFVDFLLQEEEWRAEWDE